MNTIKCTINFEDGKKISLELYPDVAPLSVENFVKLAKEGFYNGLCFHRVIPNFMVQGGGFDCRGGSLNQKAAGKNVKGEFSSNGVKNELKHTVGVISMARTNVKDSATSQFFICVADCSFLDGEYAAFGKTTDEDSAKVAKDISLVATTTVGYHSDVPRQPIIIKNIVVAE